MFQFILSYTDFEWYYVFKSPSVSMTNTKINNWSSKKHPSNFLLQSWTVDIISNTTISNTDQYAIDIRNSNITTTPNTSLKFWINTVVSIQYNFNFNRWSK